MNGGASAWAVQVADISVLLSLPGPCANTTDMRHKHVRRRMLY